MLTFPGQSKPISATECKHTVIARRFQLAIIGNAFWVVIPCGLVGYQPVTGTSELQLQVPTEIKQEDKASKYTQA
jgi:hypothetical protein